MKTCVFSPNGEAYAATKPGPRIPFASFHFDSGSFVFMGVHSWFPSACFRTSDEERRLADSLSEVGNTFHGNCGRS